MSRARPLSVLTLALVAAASSAAIVGPIACATTATADAFPPITGITIRAESLTIGRGCGRAPTEIFKYVAVVLGGNPTNAAVNDVVVASNVYDCFTDGLFVDLPLSATGSASYSVEIYAYNATAYAAAGGDGGVRAIASDRPRLKLSNPTFTTTCVAQQIGEVQSLAVCQPIAIGGAGVGGPTAQGSITLSLATFPDADGGNLACDDQYVTVRSRYGIVGGALGDITDTRCSELGDGGLQPVSITVSPAAAPASYVFQVALLRPNGTVVGETTCGAETSPGVPSSAVCQPIH